MSNMKDSGFYWLGKIPKHWELCKVKHVFYRKKAKAFQKDPIVLSLSREAIKVRDITTNEGQLAADYSEYNPVEIGDFLLNTMDLYSGANCNVSKVTGVISPAYTNLKGFENINPYFYDYYFKYLYTSMVLFSHGIGVSFDNRWTLNDFTLMNLKVPKPPLSTQIAIANFLDDKCGKIDALIENEEKIILELKEYKMCAIGEIIKRVKAQNIRLKYLLKEQLQYGANESGIDFDENLPRYIRITDIQDEVLTDENKQSLAMEKATEYLLDNGDILFARSGATVGKAFRYRKEYGLSAFAGYLIRARLKNNLLSVYVSNFTKSSLYKGFINENLIQATIQNLGANKYGNMIIPLPCENDMQKINKEAEKQCIQVDQLIAIKQQKIVELKEYKKSLIYEVVTGKREIV